MRETVRYGFILGLICLIAGGLLAGMNSLTKARILAQTQEEEESSLKEVIPTATHFEPVKSKEGEVIYYKAHDKEGRLVGVAFKTSGKGYSSTVETMVGMKIDGTITTIKILNHNETPGLGARVVEPAFTGQFTNKNIQSLNEIQAVTGATISSKAVIDSVKNKTGEIQELIKNEK
jgi:electron transport complex protein RnfG